ncbi:hypothetical protein G9A89_007741 [Geosiphon pyriformis]|nr:hypothetical protein G9A89_007741 [Geosiphon pyriformis]
MGKNHSSYGKALFQYFQKDLEIPAETTYTEIQQPVKFDLEEYENKSNNPITAQAKSTVNKKPRVLSPITPSYHQTPQIASQIEKNPSTWEQPPAQNLAELASPLMEETAILQPIGSSDKEKQLALASGEHSNMQTPIPLNITSNTPPINRIMTYWDIAKLEKFSGEEDNAYSWIADAKKAITANDAVALARDFESAKQEANHTQTVNLAINEISDIDTKITQLSEKLIQKIEGFLARTTGTYQPPQWRENNNNSRYPQQQNHQQQQQPWRSNLRNCYYCQKLGHFARDCRRKIMDQNQGNPYQQPRYQQNMVPQYSIPQNQPPLYTQQVPYTQPPPQNYYQPPPMTQTIPYYQTSPYSPSRP